MIWESVNDVRGMCAEILGFFIDFLPWRSFVCLALLIALNSVSSWFLKPIKVCLFTELSSLAPWHQWSFTLHYLFGLVAVQCLQLVICLDFTPLVIRRRVHPIQATRPCSGLNSWSTIINKRIWIYKTNCMFMYLEKAIRQCHFNLIYICNFIEGYKAPNSLTKDV